ncbi:pseudouridine synthase [Pleomorphovibrio marinus]|uniref:pseudouridine synthase n=1 Tax=Pleomorphovibrio marinus TaxID=2164132 RepID=UPI000E0C2D1B|nr:pseudouridine synthase [Pleomorphovibrio marinus]
MRLEVIFEDEDYVAINKPAGVMVHKTPLEKDPSTLFAVQLLRNQLGTRVYPLHRLDRPTSGVLLFAKSSEAASLLQPAFAGNSIKKYYLAVIRGYAPEAHGIIEQDLAKDLNGIPQEAITEYWELSRSEVPMASSPRHQTSRYALIRIYPHTGRMHQIRRHMAHIRHYIIGDSTHGDNKQNKFFRQAFGLQELLLHSLHLSFPHPISGETTNIKAGLPGYFEKMVNTLNLKFSDKDGYSSSKGEDSRG